jgi:Spy/CpxP family protein refolding chaperone
MKGLRSITAGAAIVALLGTGAAFAQGGPGGRRSGGPGGPGPFGFGGRGGGIDLPLRDLNLTDVQQQQIKDIRERHRSEAQQIGERLRAAADAERKAVQSDPVNEGLIRSTAQQLAEVQADAAILAAHERTEMLTVLTAEQQAQLKKIQADRDARLAQAAQQRQQNGANRPNRPNRPNRQR